MALKVRIVDSIRHITSTAGARTVGIGPDIAWCVAARTAALASVAPGGVWRASVDIFAMVGAAVATGSAIGVMLGRQIVTEEVGVVARCDVGCSPNTCEEHKMTREH